MMKASGSKTTKNWSKTSKKIETRTAKPVKKVLGQDSPENPLFFPYVF